MKRSILIAALAGLGLSIPGDEIGYGQLPQRGQETRSVLKGSAPIEGIERQIRNGKTVSEVEFDRLGLKRRIQFAEDGSIIQANGKPGVEVDRVPRAERGFLPSLTRIPSLQIGDVPEPVQRTVQQQAVGRAVADIDRETWNGKTVYEIEFAQSGRNAQLHVAEDGTIVRDERQGNGLKGLFMGTQLEDTPPAVQETIKREAGPGEIADIDKERRRGETIYEVDIKQAGPNAELHIAENGSVIYDSRKTEGMGAPARQTETGMAKGPKAEGEKLTFGEVPAAVQNRIRTTDEDSKVKQIQRTSREGQRVYEVELEKEGKKTTLCINDDGMILEERKE
ncbi:MAG: PepSY-like domain-containing protein [Verrucomicrobiales bacterium]|nr:PepSY-like domain-containing protein [Verrucomicrobiales bacterium]